MEDEVVFPDFRRELIAFVEELTGPLPPSQSPVFESSFVEDYVFFVDAVHIRGDLQAEVGNYLRNAQEAEALAGLLAPMDAVFGEVGDNETDDLYQAAASWPAVQSAAAHALEILQAPA